MSDKPLITYVLPTLGRGGAERIVIELAARMPARGFRTQIIVLFEQGALHQELRERDIRWSLAGGPRSMSRFELFRRLSRRLFPPEAERRPAIVHTHLFGSDVWSAAARVVHSASHLVCGKCPAEPRFVSTAHNVDRDDTTLRRAARRWAARRMDKIIAVSDEVKRYAVEDLGAKPARVACIDGIIAPKIIPRLPALPVPARPSLSQPVPARPAGGRLAGGRQTAGGRRSFGSPPQLLMVGRLEPQKGHETALRALSQISRPWQLKIIGAGSLARDLKELAERLGIASRVFFLGEVDDVASLLQTADLFLFPSRWEGLGSAALEALAAGVPVLASDLPSLRGAVPPEMRLPPDEPETWHLAVKRVFEDPRRYVALAETASVEVARRFNPENVADQYAAMYRELLGL